MTGLPATGRSTGNDRSTGNWLVYRRPAGLPVTTGLPVSDWSTGDRPVWNPDWYRFHLWVVGATIETANYANFNVTGQKDEISDQQKVTAPHFVLDSDSGFGRIRRKGKYRKKKQENVEKKNAERENSEIKNIELGKCRKWNFSVLFILMIKILYLINDKKKDNRKDMTS